MPSLGNKRNTPWQPGRLGGILKKMAKLLEQVVKELARHIPGASAMEKAGAICDWIIDSISYDWERKKAIDDGTDDGIPYHPEVTLNQGTGICCDMAVLYVAMARRMGLKTHYAHVTVDHKGNTVKHACAVVDLPIGRRLADPAYKKFGICHQKYTIREPEIKLDDGTTVQMSRSVKPFLRIAASIMATVCGLGGLAGMASCDFDKAPIRRLEFEGGTKFITQNGVLELKYDRETANTLKEYIFFCEAKGSELDDRKVLEKYLAADNDRNSHISPKEARAALEMARNEYYRKTY